MKLLTLKLVHQVRSSCHSSIGLIQMSHDLPTFPRIKIGGEAFSFRWDGIELVPVIKDFAQIQIELNRKIYGLR